MEDDCTMIRKSMNMQTFKVIPKILCRVNLICCLKNDIKVQQNRKKRVCPIKVCIIECKGLNSKQSSNCIGRCMRKIVYLESYPVCHFFRLNQWSAVVNMVMNLRGSGAMELVS
jgi:hypothetical protein